MEFFEIVDALSNEKYKAVEPTEPRPKTLSNGFITDREKSVAWNEEQVLKSKADEKAWLNKRNEEIVKAHEIFRGDLIQAIMDDLGCNLRQAIVVYSNAYESGHSDGLYQVLCDAENACAFIGEYIDCGVDTEDM